MGIFLIILILFFVCWPLIAKWLQRYMARRAEDFLRKATGMPPRSGSRDEQRSRQQASRQSDSASRGYSQYTRKYGRGQRSRRGSGEPIIPREYAVDVDFVETKDFSETTIGEAAGHSSRRYDESQVSDAEWTDIK